MREDLFLLRRFSLTFLRLYFFLAVLRVLGFSFVSFVVRFWLRLRRAVFQGFWCSGCGSVAVLLLPLLSLMAKG
jgi:hypothetical protein